jgi:pimeloyl-ACP methyl ester carboxylesterase
MPLSSRVSVAPVTIYYLHGFASSAGSTKARYFAERLAGHGLTLRTPDFNEPDFATLTITRMIEQLTADVAAAGGGPVTLIGSSLGGALAVLAAERLGDSVDRLVLLAPAVMFAKPEHHLLPPGRVEEWRARGAWPFFHYASNEERLLNFAFYEDTLRYDAFGARFSQPAVIFQGRRDRSVEPSTVEAFASTRPNVTLTLLDDDHQLISSLPRIWHDVETFLELAA